MLIEYKDLLEAVEENEQYERYLTEHIGNVQKAYQWLQENIPAVLDSDNFIEETAYYGELDDIIANHDKSKYTKLPDADNYYELKMEYDAYADYFYGEKTPEVETTFDKAWLAHIHANPHHWQHWVLVNDDDGTKALDMPYAFIIEMICDHWSFSWKSNNLYEVFDWYEKKKSNMLLSDKTRKTYEHILKLIKETLGEMKYEKS